MSAGHHLGHPIRAEHSQQLERLLADPKFTAAIANYKTTDENHDIPFLGGSDNAGRTVYIDRNFAKAVKAGGVRYDGKPYDPRPFIKLHEEVEGALLRGEYEPGTIILVIPRQKGFDYPTAHDIATCAERHAVEATGRTWDKHQDAMKPWIKADEKEKITDPPPDLLKLPYQGTPEAKEVGAAKSQGGKVSKASVHYRLGSSDKRCGNCSMYRNHICSLVCGVIDPAMVCDRWEAK